MRPFASQFSPSQEPHVVRVNWKLVAVLVGFAITVTLGGALLRKYWRAHNATGLLREAESSYAEGNLDEALRGAVQYLQLNPNDADAILKFSDWVEESPTNIRPVFHVHQAMADYLAKDPSRQDVRRRFIKFSVPLQRFNEVIQEHLPHIEDQLPNDPELLEWVVACYEGVSNLAAATALYVRAIDARPENAGLYSSLVLLIETRELDVLDLQLLSTRFAPPAPPVDLTPAGIPDDEQLSQARRAISDRDYVIRLILDAMLADSRPELSARIARASYFLKQEQLEEVQQELERAVQLDPHSRDLHLIQIEAALKDRELATLAENEVEADAARARAVAIAEASLQGDDADWRICLVMGQLEMDDGHTAEAESLLRRALDLAERTVDSQPLTVFNAPQRSTMLFRVRWSLVNALIAAAFRQTDGDQRDRKLAEIESLTEELRKSGVMPAILEFLDARRLLIARNWVAAAAALEKVRPQLKRFKDALRNVDEGLLQCYTHLQNPDLKVRVYVRALADDRFWHAGRLGLAATYAEIGLEDRSLEEYRQVQEFIRIPIGALKLQIRRILRQPPAQRDWEGIDTILQQLEETQGDSPEVIIVRAEVLFDQGRYDDAIAHLANARQGHPDQESLQRAQILVVLNRPDRALEDRIQEARRLVDESASADSVPFRLLRGEVAARQPTDTARGQLLQLSEGAEKFAELERLQLFRGLASYAATAGLPDDCLALLRKSLSIDPDDVETLTQATILAIETGQAPLEAELSEKLALAEGLSGPNLKFVTGLAMLRDYRKLLPEQRADEAPTDTAAAIPVLRLAEEDFRAAIERRPSWATAHRFLAGVLAELGEIEPALDEYKSALRHGDRSLETQARMIGLLQRQQRDEEILEVIRQVEEFSPLLISEDIARAGMQAAFRSKQWDEALSRSGKIGLSTLADKLIRAQLLLARRDNPEEVEQLLKDATELAPENPQAWYLRVSALLREGREDEARKVIAQADEQVPATPESLRPYTRAILNELINNVDEAHRQFQAAHQNNPQRLPILNEHINFCLRNGRITEAQGLLQVLMNPDNGLDEALRQRAITTHGQLQAASASNYREFDAAVRRLGADEDLSALGPDNLQALAQAYSRSRRRKDQLKLIRVLEELQNRNLLQPTDRLYLAGMLEEEARWKEAWSLYRQLMEEDPANTSITARFVQGAISQKQFDAQLRFELDRAVSSMQLNEGESLRTQVVQAQLLAVRKQAESAGPALQTLLSKIDDSPPADLFRELVRLRRSTAVISRLETLIKAQEDRSAQLLLPRVRQLINNDGDGPVLITLRPYLERPEIVSAMRCELAKLVAGLFESLELTADAERTCERLRNAYQTVDGSVALATFHAAHHNLDRALEVAGELQDRLDSAPLEHLKVNLLRTARAERDDARGVEDHLRELTERAIEGRAPESDSLLAVQAELYELQSRFPEAIAIYRRLLERNGRNILALNNLAWLLSFDSDSATRESALTLIDQAIQLAGEIPDLLDTRSVVLLNLNRADQAIVNLQQALDDVSTPTLWYHLAVASLRAKSTDEARRSLERARAADFRDDTLHPLERPMYDELLREMGTPLPPNAG